mgnify:CR=1 FL=1
MNEMVQIWVEKNIYISFLIIESLSSNHAIKMYRKNNFCSKGIDHFLLLTGVFPIAVRYDFKILSSELQVFYPADSSIMNVDYMFITNAKNPSTRSHAPGEIQIT